MKLRPTIYLVYLKHQAVLRMGIKDISIRDILKTFCQVKQGKLESLKKKLINLRSRQNLWKLLRIEVVEVPLGWFFGPRFCDFIKINIFKNHSLDLIDFNQRRVLKF